MQVPLCASMKQLIPELFIPSVNTAEDDFITAESGFHMKRLRCCLLTSERGHKDIKKKKISFHTSHLIFLCHTVKCQLCGGIQMC